MENGTLNAPLRGVHIVEFEGLGPGPLAGLFLTHMGARITLISRPARGAVNAQLSGGRPDPMRVGKSVVTLDLKRPGAIAEALALIAQADGLIEGNRPGVMERLGLGPADCAAHNPKLVYGRMTGWGQSGPLASVAGHDLNYVALSGLLSLSAHGGQRPLVPPTVVGDAAGALGLAFGMVCALLDARRSGRGRVVDGAIVDTVAMLGNLALFARAGGQLDGPGPSPFHDSPFYDVYACQDGQYITLAPLEPQFYALLLNRVGFSDVDPARQYDTSTWPELKARFTTLFASRTRSHWCSVFEGTDVCFAPVLSMAEAVEHPHNRARGIFHTAADGTITPASAPRFLALKPD